MPELCDLQIHVNGQQTFFLNEKIVSKFSGKLQRMIKQEKRRTQIRNSCMCIQMNEFPGGPDGFELVSRFCYNNGKIKINVSNVCILHCCAVFLGMSEKVTPTNLLYQTERFLDEMLHWSWTELLTCLGSTELFFCYADSVGLVEKLMCSLLAKIAQNSDIHGLFASSSPETSSRVFRLSTSTTNTPDLRTKSSPLTKAWWFDDLTLLPPVIIETFIRTLGAYGSDNNNLLLTRFLLHYLKTAAQSKENYYSRSTYSGLADTAVYGVVLMGKNAFSCRGMFWVLRIVSGFGVSRDCRNGLEREIGGVLDQATLDDLLVSGGANGGVYDVSLVIRMIRVFVNNYDKVLCLQKMKKVGRLIDNYLGEIAPDQSLKIKKFIGVAQSLPHEARDCFDGLYRAIDIYLESHPSVSLEERSRLCRCVSYEKLSLEACKELAKNPRIPPRIAVEALASQHSNINIPAQEYCVVNTSPSPRGSNKQMVLYNSNGVDFESFSSSEESDEIRLNLERMQWRVVELEKVCRDMKGQMSRMGKIPTSHTRALPRLC